MKAFERLEKAEQRRQENQAKQAHRKEQLDSTSSGTQKKEVMAEGKRHSVDEREELQRHQINKPPAADRPRRKRYCFIKVLFIVLVSVVMKITLRKYGKMLYKIEMNSRTRFLWM